MKPKLRIKIDLDNFVKVQNKYLLKGFSYKTNYFQKKVLYLRKSD